MNNDTLKKATAVILASGWLVSGILFAQQLLEIYLHQDASGISIFSFFGFCFLNANATVYAYLHGHTWWIPGTILASVSSGLIAICALIY